MPTSENYVINFAGDRVAPEEEGTFPPSLPGIPMRKAGEAAMSSQQKKKSPAFSVHKDIPREELRTPILWLSALKVLLEKKAQIEKDLRTVSKEISCLYLSDLGALHLKFSPLDEQEEREIEEAEAVGL